LPLALPRARLRRTLAPEFLVPDSRALCPRFPSALQPA